MATLAHGTGIGPRLGILGPFNCSFTANYRQTPTPRNVIIASKYRW